MHQKTMDYLSYWSLRCKPFMCPDCGAFFSGGPQRAAIAGLNDFLRSPSRAALLVAPAGCGTTRLLAHLGQMRGCGDCAIEMMMTRGDQGRQQTRDAFVRSLGFHHGDQGAPSHIKRALNVDAGRVRTVWLIDRCHRAAACLARRLVFDHANLDVVLAIDHRQLDQRMVEIGHEAVRIDLSSLSLADTIRYLRYGVEHAGGGRATFSDRAAARLHAASGGVLATLASLAEESLRLAARRRLDQVAAFIVDAAAGHSVKAA